MSTTRNDAVRAMLVERVRASRPHRWRLPLIGVGAFVVAGALTGGAIAGSLYLQSTSDRRDTEMLQSIGQIGYNRAVGDRVERLATGPTSLRLPERPGDRSAVVAIAGECPATTTLSVRVGTGPATDVPCGASATLVEPPGSGDVRDVTVMPDRGGAYTVWAVWAVPDPLPGPSAQQRDAVADGVVTRSEYLAAFNRYLGCMRALGHPYGPISTSSTTFLLGIPSSALMTSDRCAASEFDQVDALWQSEHPDGGAQQYDPATDDPRYAR